ncbi:MAG: hypothetical protein WB341_01560 [Terracidiphilus sp.]
MVWSILTTKRPGLDPETWNVLETRFHQSLLRSTRRIVLSIGLFGSRTTPSFAHARSAAALDQAITEALRSITAQNAAARLCHGGYQGTAIMEPR